MSDALNERSCWPTLAWAAVAAAVLGGVFAAWQQPELALQWLNALPGCGG